MKRPQRMNRLDEARAYALRALKPADPADRELLLFVADHPNPPEQALCLVMHSFCLSEGRGMLGAGTAERRVRAGLLRLESLGMIDGKRAVTAQGMKMLGRESVRTAEQERADVLAFLRSHVRANCDECSSHILSVIDDVESGGHVGAVARDVALAKEFSGARKAPSAPRRKP